MLLLDGYLLLTVYKFFFKAYYNPLLLIGITQFLTGGLLFYRCLLMNEVLNLKIVVKHL